MTFRQNMELGTDFTIKSLKDEGYAAIVLALGAHRSRNLGVKGEDKRGVYHAVAMLRDIASGDPPDLRGKRIVVVGGGDTAMDAARLVVAPRRGRGTRGLPPRADRHAGHPRGGRGRARRACSSTSWRPRSQSWATIV